MTTPTGGSPMEKKSMNSPDETRTFEKGKLELNTFFLNYFYRPRRHYHSCRVLIFDIRFVRNNCFFLPIRFVRLGSESYLIVVSAQREVIDNVNDLLPCLSPCPPGTMYSHSGRKQMVHK
jgi:hypothetical protein